MATDARPRIQHLIGDNGSMSTGRVVASAALVLAIVAGVGDAVMNTVPDLSAAARARSTGIGILAVAVFAVEYLLRLWIAPLERPAAAGPASSRLAYAASFLGLVDLLAALPRLVEAILPIEAIAVDLLVVVALFKLVRYVPGLSLVAAVFRNEARSLLAAIVAMLILLIVVSSIMYALEREAQPEMFSSIPRSLWWGIVTIASVGYGDMTPVTPLGRVFGGCVMLIGIAMFAVPAGIIATGFAAEVKKRDFVVTWQAVAKVPLFAGLDAARIAEIAQLLRPEHVPPRYVIVRRGDAAEAMYFIISGEVEVDVAAAPIHLRSGQYFGEIALLRDTQRTATVTAVTDCQLLTLGVGDFRHLMRKYPDLEADLRRVAEGRLKQQ